MTLHAGHLCDARLFVPNGNDVIINGPQETGGGGGAVRLRFTNGIRGNCTHDTQYGRSDCPSQERYC